MRDVQLFKPTMAPVENVINLFFLFSRKIFYFRDGILRIKVGKFRRENSNCKIFKGFHIVNLIFRSERDANDLSKQDAIIQEVRSLVF
jgi:hypothetical protein